MPLSSNAVRRACTGAGAAGVAAGCAGMVAMLPGAAAGALGALGIGGSSALARGLSPVAEPVFIVSAVLLVLGGLACSRLVALLAVAGSVALYLSMFQLASGATTNRHGSMSMMSMQQPDGGSSALQANATSFYLGLALLVAALGLSVWRRRRRECRPVVRLPRLALR
jgi:hypothetical protein